MTAYIKLVKAKDSDMRDDIMDYDGEDTTLLDCYVAAVNDDGYDLVYKDDIGTVSIAHINTVTVIGADFETRCYMNKTRAYKDAEGTLWLEEDRFEEVFC